MKRVRVFVLLIMVFLLCAALPAYAELLKIGTASYDSDGNGTPEEYNLIYMAEGPFGPVTWLDYTRGYDSWQDQVNWAAGLGSRLTVTLNPGYSTSNVWSTGWRLPETNETSDYVFNSTTSEMGYLYYEELGNKGLIDTNGNYQEGWGLKNTGDFENLQANLYWSGTEYSHNPYKAWYIYYVNGLQDYYYKSSCHHYGLAVHPGEVSAAVPEPGTFLLFGAGLAGLRAWRNKFRRRFR